MKSEEAPLELHQVKGSMNSGNLFNKLSLIMEGSPQKVVESGELCEFFFKRYSFIRSQMMFWVIGFDPEQNITQ